MLVFIIKLLAFFFISCLISASLLFKLSVLPLLIILFDLVFVGCVGIRDSLRNGVKEAVLKCAYLAFEPLNFSKNYGKIFMTILLILFGITMIIYFIKGSIQINLQL